MEKELRMKKLLLVLVAGTFTLNANAFSLLGSGVKCDKKTPETIVDLDIKGMGDIYIQLDKKAAPKTVANFIQYVNDGFYKDKIFHRVIPGFMIQGGGFDKNMTQAPTRASIKNEANNGLKNDKYTISMARTQDPDSASSQFFINVNGNDSLNYAPGNPGYAVFGHVIKGQNVVDKIAAVKTTSVGPYQDVPVTPVVIKSAKLICK